MRTSCSQETMCPGTGCGLCHPRSLWKLPPGNRANQTPEGASFRTCMKQVNLSNTELDPQGQCTVPPRSLFQDQMTYFPQMLRKFVFSLQELPQLKRAVCPSSRPPHQPVETRCLDDTEDKGPGPSCQFRTPFKGALSTGLAEPLLQRHHSPTSPRPQAAPCFAPQLLLSVVFPNQCPS